MRPTGRDVHFMSNVVFYGLFSLLFVCLCCCRHGKIKFIYCLFSFPLAELEETTGTPPYYVDEDYPAGPEINEPLPE